MTRSFWWVSAALFAFAAATLGAPDDITERLRAFSEKAASQTAAASSSVISRSERGSVTSQLKMLSGLITRGDFERAQQLISSAPVHGPSPELQTEWNELSLVLLEQIEKAKAKAVEELRVQVDALVNDVRTACLNATTSAEVEPLLIRAAALQMRRSGQENAVAQRVSQKLSAAASLVETWCRYLDLTKAGKADQGTEVLRSLLRDGSQFPILTVAEIGAKLASASKAARTDRKQLTPRERAQKLFDPINTPEDLPAAVERLEVIRAESESGQRAPFDAEDRLLQQAMDATSAAKRGDYLPIVRLMPGSGEPEVARFIARLQDAVVRPRLAEILRAPAEVQLTAEDNAQTYLDRILANWQSKANYAGIVDTLRGAERLGTLVAALPTDRLITEKFLAAQRFDNAGDAISAVNAYRSVAGATGTRYAPVQAAADALTRLQAKQPEVLKDYQGVILQELREIREILQRQPNYPAGYPRPGVPR